MVLLDPLRVAPRQDEHRGGGRDSADPPRRLDPVELGHEQVHHGDVGLELLGQVHGVATVDRLAADLPGRMCLEQVPESLPQQRMIVRNQDLEHGPTLTIGDTESARPSLRTPGPAFQRFAVG
jgi:hypothetical protein